MASLRDLVIAKSRRDGACLIYMGYLNAKGYGTVGKRHQRAHRVVYEAAHGPIPIDQELDHTCGRRACVEISHLEAVTHAENVRRQDHFAREARKAHGCTRWHPGIAADLGPTGRCRICDRRRKAAAA
jgi:HNH endonuclease